MHQIELVPSKVFTMTPRGPDPRFKKDPAYMKGYNSLAKFAPKMRKLGAAARRNLERHLRSQMK